MFNSVNNLLDLLNSMTTMRELLPIRLSFICLEWNTLSRTFGTLMDVRDRRYARYAMIDNDEETKVTPFGLQPRHVYSFERNVKTGLRCVPSNHSLRRRSSFLKTSPNSNQRVGVVSSFVLFSHREPPLRGRQSDGDVRQKQPYLD